LLEEALQIAQNSHHPEAQGFVKYIEKLLFSGKLQEFGGWGR
jgi:hypothetical protein